jgi:hypothetical protein
MTEESPAAAKVKPLKINQDDVKTEQNYYLYIECLSESCELNLILE